MEDTEQKTFDLGDIAKRTLDDKAFLLACEVLLNEHSAIEELALDGDKDGKSIEDINARIVYRAMMRRAVQDIQTKLHAMVWDAERLAIDDEEE